MIGQVIRAAAAGELPPLVDMLQTGGTLGVLAFLVLGFIRGWVVTPGRFGDMKATAEMWQKVAERREVENTANARTAEAALVAAQTAVSLLNELKEARNRTTRARRPRDLS